MLADRIKKIKLLIKYKDHLTFWYILNLIVSFLLIAGLALTIYFISQNINTAFSTTTIITDLQTNHVFDSIDLNSYNKAKGIITAKKTKVNIPTDLRNIFYFQKTDALPDNNYETAKAASTKTTSTEK